jgi:hypothetical protein
MNDLELKATDSTPYMRFECKTGLCEISGTSMPENVYEVYEPVLEWIKEYIKSPCPKTMLSISLKYFNTASAKIILSLLYAFEPLLLKGNSIEVNWGYLSHDEESLEAGQDYASMINIPFNFVKID